MNFLQAIQSGLSKYAVFEGRASRSEYWWFQLFVALAAGPISILSEWASGVAALLLFLPSLALAVRRLHDTDKSGWWLLLVLIPLIGAVVLLVFYLTRGTDGSNRFGPDPLRALPA
jgi:uncharacterized membrane protein YhaH (DUF805 family)